MFLCDIVNVSKSRNNQGTLGNNSRTTLRGECDSIVCARACKFAVRHCAPASGNKGRALSRLLRKSNYVHPGFG